VVTFLYHKSALPQAAQWLIDQFGSAKVVCFHGSMGAGKTTLIHAICQCLGMQGSFSSPTFPIINEYTCADGTQIHHLDLYRLESLEEAERAGVIDALYQPGISLVEWPEKLPEIVPPDAIHVQIQVIDAEKRSLQLTGAGQ
jgi:tRNA threonylcarbamoyladenosine biosynthesis protein TsaE